MHEYFDAAGAEWGAMEIVTKNATLLPLHLKAQQNRVHLDVHFLMCIFHYT